MAAPQPPTQPFPTIPLHGPEPFVVVLDPKVSGPASECSVDALHCVFFPFRQGPVIELLPEIPPKLGQTFGVRFDMHIPPCISSLTPLLSDRASVEASESLVELLSGQIEFPLFPTSHLPILCLSGPLCDKCPPLAPRPFWSQPDLRYYGGLCHLQETRPPCQFGWLVRSLEICQSRSWRLPDFSRTHFQTCRPRRPRRSVDPPFDCLRRGPGCLRPSARDSASLRLFALSRLIRCGLSSLRPACS